MLRRQGARPEEVIPHLLKSLHHSLRQAADAVFRRAGMGMSFAHFAALYTLECEPGVPGAELARRAFVTAQTMNTILRRLERDGDIERRPHPSKARADSWYITRAGQQRLRRAKAVGDALWARMLGTLKAAEVTQLQSLLERCIAGLDAQVDAPLVRKKTVSRQSVAPARGVDTVTRRHRNSARG